MHFQQLIIEPFYLPISAIFSFSSYCDSIVIDDDSTFIKQSFRNRAYIASANGKQSLTIPLKQGKTKLSNKEVQIDYSTNWQRIHWQSIISAYNNSPFFEFYAENFCRFYHKEYHFLIDFTTAIFHELLQSFHLKSKLLFLSENNFIENSKDIRGLFHPK